MTHADYIIRDCIDVMNNVIQLHDSSVVNSGDVEQVSLTGAEEVNDRWKMTDGKNNLQGRQNDVKQRYAVEHEGSMANEDTMNILKVLCKKFDRGNPILLLSF